MKRPTKAEIRRELEQHTQAYLQQGGNVVEVSSGETGLVDGAYRNASFTFTEPRQERTPLNKVVAAIDSRRTAKKPPVTTTKVVRSRKKVIYDDFGEPLRVIWVTE
ncbi:MAG: hypothetical protein V7731_12060 [Amphritea sp.]